MGAPNKELVPGFTKRYNVKMLVYYEQFQNIGFAIHRETRLKKMEASVETGIDREHEPALERFCPNGLAFDLLARKRALQGGPLSRAVTKVGGASSPGHG